MDYFAPEAIRDECKAVQTSRQTEMIEAFHKDPTHRPWVPDEQDIIDEQLILLSNTMVASDKYAVGKGDMSRESLDRMKQGKKPLREEDKGWVTSSVE